MSRNFDRAQEMVVASMEYIKVLGCRIRRTEVQRDDWKKVALFHADEVIKLRQRVDELKAERDAAKQEAVSARQDATHAEPDLTQLHAKGKEAWSDVPNATQWVEEMRGNTEATHDTPEGKETAEGAVMPKPGDVVRLVRVPTLKEYPHDSGCWEPNWGGIDDHMRVHYVGSNITGTRVVRAVFGLEWPVSCVEVVKGGKS